MTTNTRNIVQKSALCGIFDPTVILVLDLLTPKFYAFIFAQKSVCGDSLVKFHQQILTISC